MSAEAAAAIRRQLEREEEEEVIPHHPDPSAPFEYKIIRSATGAFRNPAKFTALLEEEARAGWDLLEKLDDSRARLKREITWRQRDGELGQDPYRTRIGVCEGTILIWAVLGFLAGFAALCGILACLL